MGKKNKKSNDVDDKNIDKQKLENKLTKITNKISESRQKMVKVLSKLAAMEVHDYSLLDWNNNQIKFSEMFGDKSDLIVIHNMGKSCSYCTMWADGFNGVFQHIEKRASFVVVSPNEPEVQKQFALSRGWRFKMYSGAQSSFIKDMGFQTDKGDYWPGFSLFKKNPDGTIIRIAKDFFGPGDFYCSVWGFFDFFPKAEK
jgi:predicted dithiol-disulfide oxidoreductase (DUF899 family)